MELAETELHGRAPGENNRCTHLLYDKLGANEVPDKTCDESDPLESPQSLTAIYNEVESDIAATDFVAWRHRRGNRRDNLSEKRDTTTRLHLGSDNALRPPFSYSGRCGAQ